MASRYLFVCDLMKSSFPQSSYIPKMIYLWAGVQDGQSFVYQE
jgi:hypothetical protein